MGLFHFLTAFTVPGQRSISLSDSDTVPFFHVHHRELHGVGDEVRG
jgi:hypothetical protein